MPKASNPLGLFRAAQVWWDHASTRTRLFAAGGLSVALVALLVAAPQAPDPATELGLRVQVADLPQPLSQRVGVGKTAFTVPNHAACMLLEDYQAQQVLAAQGDRDAWASFMVDHAPNCTWVKSRIRVYVTDVSGLYAWVKFRPEGSYQEFYADSEAVEAELSEAPSTASSDVRESEEMAREALRRIAAWEMEEYQRQGRFAENNSSLDSLTASPSLAYHVKVQMSGMYVAEVRHTAMPGRHCIIFGTPPSSNGLRRELSGGGRFNQIDCRPVPAEWRGWPGSP